MNHAPSNSNPKGPAESASNGGIRRSPSDESPERERSDTPDVAQHMRNQGTIAASLEQPTTPPEEFEEILSIWPAVVAAGVTFTAFGVVTSVGFSIFGILVFIAGVTGWVGELIRE